MSNKTVSKEASQTVSPGQWFRLVFAYLLIPLILFISAWDLSWWQAWTYTVLILVAGIGGRLWAEQRQPGLTAERQNIESIQNAKDWDKVLAPLMAISVSYPMVLVAGLDHHYQWSPEFPLWLSITGFILIAFGYTFSAWAIAENRFFPALYAFKRNAGMWYVIPARNVLFGIRVMPEIFLHCSELFLL